MHAYYSFVKQKAIAKRVMFAGGACLEKMAVIACRMLLALAPMQDVTDLAFMRTLARVGSLPDVFVTPYFRSTTTTCALGEANLRCIRENETGVPIWAQLAGSDAAALVRDARALMQEPIAGIDLNAGCPSPLVNRHGAGAGLLREPENFSRILHALREEVPAGRFSVKCRLGWAEVDEFPALLERISAASPDWVTVHARTRQGLYNPAALRPQWVAKAVEALSCPVLANGDIEVAEAAPAWVAATGAAGVMIGRGAVRNPYIFRQLRGGKAPTAAEMKRYYAILIEETGRILTRRTEKGHCNRMKKYLAFCYPDFTEEEQYHLRRCTDTADMARLLGL